MKITFLILTIDIKEYSSFFITCCTHIYSLHTTFARKVGQMNSQSSMIFAHLLKAQTSTHHEVNFHSRSGSHCLHQSLGNCSGYAVIPDIFQSPLNERLTQRYFSIQKLGHSRSFGSYSTYILNAQHIKILSVKKKFIN